MKLRLVPIKKASDLRYVAKLTWREIATVVGEVRGAKFQPESIRRAVESARKKP